MEENGGVLEITVEKEFFKEDNAFGCYHLSAGEYLKIRISDTGHGIDPEILNRIFEPFFTTSTDGKTSGFGLAFVQGIVKCLHGAITVDSQLEKGATFTVRLPVIAEKIDISNKDAEEIPLGNESIILLDDEETIANMTGKILEGLGYKVEVKSNPFEAFELFRSKPDKFDLVITEMKMQAIIGIKLFEKLKEIRPDIPVIFHTGNSSQIDEKKAREIGISAFVTKPVFRSDIARTIRKVLDEAKKSTQT
jgi:CheY-like chemotaxis protein